MARVKQRIEICADCGNQDPSWASVNKGILLCDECCSVHRSLGRHRSQVKSLHKSAWSPSQLNMVHTLYSSGSNSIWEHSLLDPNHGSKNSKKKPTQKDPLHPVKADFIKAKHQNFLFVHRPNKEEQTEEDLSQQLYSSVRTPNVETSLRLISYGADPNYHHPDKGNSPMHVAASFGQPSQVELLYVYGADPAMVDSEGKTPSDSARKAGYNEIADRLIDCQYEVTDRLTFYLCGRKPDHKIGQHFIIPEMADSLDLSELAKIAKTKLQALPNNLFEELAMDVYDEVDRRENDAIWLSTQNHSALVMDRQTVPFLPVNPEFSTTRNQGRQKLARFNAREFATLIIDILNEAKRRHLGLPVISPSKVETAQNGRQPNSSGEKGNMSDDEPVYDSVASDDEIADYQRHSGGSSLQRVNSRSSNDESKVCMADVVTAIGTCNNKNNINNNKVRSPKVLHDTKVLNRSSEFNELLLQQRPCCHCGAIAPKNSISSAITEMLTNGMSLKEEKRGKSLASSDAPITLNEYMDVKKQLASSEAKINMLLRNNKDMKQEISILQSTVHTLMQENTRLRSIVGSNESPLRATTTTNSHMGGSMANGYEPVVAERPHHHHHSPIVPVTTNPYVSEGLLTCGGTPGRSSSPRGSSNHQRPQSMYEARERHPQLGHTWGGSSYNSQTGCCPPYGYSLPRDDSGIGHTHSSLSSRNSGDYDNASSHLNSHNRSVLLANSEPKLAALTSRVNNLTQIYLDSSCHHSRSNSMSPPTETPPPIIPGRPSHTQVTQHHPRGSADGLPTQDEVVRKTEQITKKIQELLISAQEGKNECFIPCSEKIYRAVVEMASIFPQTPHEENIHSALKQLTGCAIRLQLECRTLLSQQQGPVDYRFVTQQVIQCAYDIAKAAKQVVTFFE